MEHTARMPGRTAYAQLRVQGRTPDRPQGSDTTEAPSSGGSSGVSGVSIYISPLSRVDRVAATHPMSGDGPHGYPVTRAHPDRPRRPGPLGVHCMGVHACMGVHHARAVPDRWVSDPVRPMVRCTTTVKPGAPADVPPFHRSTATRRPLLLFRRPPAAPCCCSTGPRPPPAGAVPPSPAAVPRMQPARYRNRGTCYWPRSPQPPACKPAGLGTRCSAGCLGPPGAGCSGTWE